jgi:hypothetical protein
VRRGCALETSLHNTKLESKINKIYRLRRPQQYTKTNRYSHIMSNIIEFCLV